MPRKRRSFADNTTCRFCVLHSYCTSRGLPDVCTDCHEAKAGVSHNKPRRWPTWNGNDGLRLCDNINKRATGRTRYLLWCGLQIPGLQANVLQVLNVPPLDCLPVRLQLHNCQRIIPPSSHSAHAKHHPEALSQARKTLGQHTARLSIHAWPRAIEQPSIFRPYQPQAQGCIGIPGPEEEASNAAVAAIVSLPCIPKAPFLASQPADA